MKLSTIIGACAIGGIVSGLGIVSAIAQDDALPPGKVQAIQDAQVVDPSSIPESITERPKTADVGPGALVAQVKAAAPELLAADVALGRLPQSLAQRDQIVRGQKAERSAKARSLWDSGSSEKRVSELERGLALVVNDSGYMSFTDNRFVVTEWQGVQIEDNSANVTVIGHPEYADESGVWTSDSDRQYQLELLRGGPGSQFGWNLASIVERYVGG